MARLLGFIANRPDLCNRFTSYERHALVERRPQNRASDGEPEPWGWGIGFYQGGEVLLKRRPLEDADTIDLADLLGDVRSDLVVAQVRRATVGSLRTDNTHPFRYRQWLFANTGTVAGSDVRSKLFDSLPEFLQRSLRGDTDSELLFHLFLSFLHDAGKLDHFLVPPEDVFRALKSTLSLLDRMARDGRDQAAGPIPLNVIVATPDYLVAVNRGATMGFRRLAGRDELEPLFEGREEGPLRMPDLAPCRLAAIAADFQDDELPTDWTAVPPGAMVALSRTDDPVIVEP